MKWRWFTLIWAVLVAVIIWMADQHGPQHAFAWLYYVPGGDKLGHWLLIGGLAFLLNLSLQCRCFTWAGRRWLLGSAVVLGLAALEEASQIFLPSRTADWGDFAADLLGIWMLGGCARLFLPPTRQADSCKSSAKPQT